jgi:TetR/AcrR family transcriptional regulator, transcriptional repressor for nem operon
MGRPSHRDKILDEGLRVVHARGFAAASVRDIVRAAGVPQGSFTNHFASKEAFGLEILDRYFAGSCELMDRTLRNDALPPLDRLRAYVGSATRSCEAGVPGGGCLLGNFSAEAGEHSEPLRRRLVEMFAATEAALAYCLKAAVEAGELSAGLDCEGTAALILSALQGATLLAKAEQSPAPLERLEKTLFATVLAPTTRG